MKTKKNIIKTPLLLLSAFVLLLLPGLKLPYLDKAADTYFSESIEKASMAYGVCRLVNASVSVVKESQVQIEPAGLGVSLAVGQVLDPLDDMTERASDILTTSIVSLGIQKIAFELCVAFAPPLIGLVVIIFAFLSFLGGDRARKLKDMTLKAIILLTVARLCLPASSTINAYLQEHYFTPQIMKVKDELAMHSPAMERLKDMNMPETDGVLGTVKNGFDYVGEKASELGLALKFMIDNTGKMISNLLKLSYLYGAIFIVQVILLPLGVFWILARITNLLFGTNIPYILKRNDEKLELVKRQDKTKNGRQNY